MRLLFLISVLISTLAVAQTNPAVAPLPVKAARLKAVTDGFVAGNNCFIKNIGQYNAKRPLFSKMGPVLYGYEGWNMPVVFTPKGMIYVHRQAIKKKTEGGLKISDTTGEEEDEEWETTDKFISMEWVGANPAVQVLAEEPRTDYHTYGFLPQKAGLYKKLIYKELYPGIDLVYSFPVNQAGFEYSMILKPGADPAVIKMKFGGDLKKISTDENGNLVIRSAIEDIYQTAPLSFNTDNNNFSLPSGRPSSGTIATTFQAKGNTISFNTGDYNHAQTLVIDPFISSTSTLSGQNAGKAKDVDFDYAGNIYVTGGGNPTLEHKLAKYDAAGNLVWTFNGTLLNPDWFFGTESGGWTVDKNTGKIYLGQGFSTLGSQIVRLDAAGVYDNFQTAPNPAFKENWKMMWLCTNGAEQILVVGGGIATNNNLAFFTPSSSGGINGINITGISSYAQDISDIARDPANNDIYTIFASASLTLSVNNQVYKHVFPYAPSDIQWTQPSGFAVMDEASNRPYLSASNSDNSTNLFSVNSNYLFYWDGKNLKAFNKSDGLTAGVPISIAGNQALMQGGIFADQCNNVFIGSKNGLIKVYKFDGTNFDDAAAPDITITGYPNASVYDLAFDENRKLLYASGDGFVASFDVSAYCSSTNIFSLAVSTSCPGISAQASISPPPPSGAVVTYTLFSGSTQLASNSTGFFPGLNPALNYTVKVNINQVCVQLEISKDFNLNTCVTLTLNSIHTNPSCHDASNGSITATASAGSVPYQYSIDNGLNFQTGNVFSGLAAGTYTILARDAFWNLGVTTVTLTNPPALQVTASTTRSNCSAATGTITAVGSLGVAPIQYSLDGIVFQLPGNFTSLAPGNYTVTARDANGCTGTTTVTVDVQNTVTANAGAPVAVCAGQSTLLNASSNGTSFSWSPATGLDNPLILNPTATPASTTTYILTATTGYCSSTSSVTVSVKPLPAVNAGADFNLCEGTTRQMAASSDGQSFVWTPATGLSDPNILNPVVRIVTAPYTTTTYTLTATKDLCQNSATVKVTTFPAPVANAGSGASICYGQSVQLNGSGGVAYQWRPVSFLSAYNIANPVVNHPTGSITYHLTVTDANGCSSLQPADVSIRVSPPPQLFAGNDTVVAMGQPLPLLAKDVNGLGFNSFTWTPATGLNSALIQNPVAVLNQDITYTVTASNVLGCSATDVVRIKVFKGPDIYVPDAFTPNGDNRNDIMRAIPVGISEFRYFTIYSRFGEKIFSTTNAAAGWDGYHRGEPQAPGAYVWIAEGVDYRGQVVKKKGTLLLIR